MTNPGDFTFLCRTKTLFGVKALAHLPFELWGMGVRKPMVIMDDSARAAQLTTPLCRIFKESNMILGISAPIDGDRGREEIVDSKIIQELYRIYTDRGFDAVIALGTGRVADMAKNLNIAVSLGPGVLKKRDDNLKIVHSLSPWAYVPTGVGTGSETGCQAVFNRHMIDSPFLAPDLAVIDPVMLLTETPTPLINAGLTALSVCCEAYVCLNNPPARAYAATGIRLVMESLLPLLIFLLDTAPGLKKKVHKNAAAEHLAKITHASVITGYLLANGERLTGFKLGSRLAHYCSVSPGVAMAIILPALLELSADHVADAGRVLLPLAGPDGFAAVPKFRQWSGVIHKLHDIMAEIHRIFQGTVPRTLEDMGMDMKQVKAFCLQLSAGKDVPLKGESVKGEPTVDPETAESILAGSLNNRRF